MTTSPTAVLRVGDWRVDPVAGHIRRGDETVRLEARAMRLLVSLAARPGETFSVDDLLDAVWPDVTVSPDSVYQAVAQLRRLLGDDPKEPRYIVTAPRLGYRLVAEVGPWSDEAPPPSRRFPRRTAVAAGLGVLALAAGAGWFYPRPAPSPASAASTAAATIAVMPFLDLTDAMDQEPFADGITEELIDQLARAGLKVAAPRATFAYKGRLATPGDVSRALSVAYVLDGSVRKSGDRVRVAARLVRGDDSFVAWSQSYDRPAADLLWVQEDIAGEVARALGGPALQRTMARP